MDSKQIAPCGMNCGICSGYLRKNKHCSGCRGSDDGKSVSILNCIIRNCPTPKTNRSGFCFECEDFPCKRLRALDKRYRTKYRMSMIENLENVEKLGIDGFLRNDSERWRCKKCGGVINVHRGTCSECGEPRTAQWRRESLQKPMGRSVQF